MVKVLKDKKIIIWGLGEFFEYYFAEKFPVELRKNVSYMVDSKPPGDTKEVWGRKLNMYSSEVLKDERDCAIILTSSNYSYDIYKQLDGMEIDDSIECFPFCSILACSVGKNDSAIEKEAFDINRPERIPKKIHYFWFSGDEKPEEYQKCIDSWKRNCPDYEIIEWNMTNYDAGDNKFVKGALEAKKWAFASDFARLDVIYKYGGIYLDSDLEIVTAPDTLLGNKAFFTFDSSNDIDLCLIGSEKGNPLLAEIKKLYDNVEFSVEKMTAFTQPRYIRDVLKRHGVALDGNMQQVEDNVFLPRKYFSPLDNFCYEMLDDSESVIGIHHCNAGWRNNGFKSQRIKKNRELDSLCEMINI